MKANLQFVLRVQIISIQKGKMQYFSGLRVINHHCKIMETIYRQKRTLPYLITTHLHFCNWITTRKLKKRKFKGMIDWNLQLIVI